MLMRSVKNKAKKGDLKKATTSVSVLDRMARDSLTEVSFE